MPIQAEGGLRKHRIEFVDETTQGTTPSNPSWELFSDTVRSFEWSPDTQVETVLGLGDAAPSQFFKGPEQHEVSITYDLQQKTSTGNTLLDGSSNNNDAATDGLTRDADNLLATSHSIVDREDKGKISAEEALGPTSRPTRIYTVAKGALHDEVVFTGDPGSQQPISTEISYQSEKVRSYQIDQPNSSTELVVKSSSANDTTQTLTVEDEGAATSATFTLNGTSLATDSATFDDIDAAQLDAETEGDITIAENDGTTASPTEGDTLMIIRGSNTYSGIEGDLGVPTLGTGSHAAAIGESFETILGDTIERPSGTDLAFDINSFEFSVANNIERTSRVDALTERLHPGTHDITVTATVLGETETHSQIEEHLQVTSNDIKWTLSGGSIQADNARLTGPGSRTVSAGESTLSIDSEFIGDGVTLT